MADVEEPQFTTLAERIAALNKQKNFKAPEPKAKRPPPPPPPGKLENRSQTLPVAPVAATPTPSIPPRPISRTPSQFTPPPSLPGRTPSATQHPPPASRGPPPLPTRSNTNTLSPALPPRRPSAQQLEVRRGSNASEISTLSSLSLGHGTVSSATSIHSLDAGRKLPPAFDPSSLPALPPTKREREAQAQQEAAARKASTSSQIQVRPPPLPSTNGHGHSTHAVRQIETPQRPVLPPRLSNTSVKQPAQPAQTHTLEPAEPPRPRRLPPPTIPTIKARQPEQEAAQPPPMPSRPKQRAQDDDDAPPPIPMSSRPSVAQIDAAVARIPPPIPQANDCLICRDFSGPDGVAAQYPRETLPRDDVVGYLAHVLCGPFTSHTDKARAIFTWFHHNIAYDCAAFFGNNIRGRPADETIFKGLAVCSGYADTYKAIATRAGLECVVVVGHGKGYGYTALKKGERPPPKKADGHAWNAVRIDGGAWKLLDACWGAGNVSETTKAFTKDFKPHEFTRTNEVFGDSHFPQDERYFFRADGSVPTWEAYFIGRVHGDAPVVYTSAAEEGIWDRTVEPRERQIPVYSGQVVRFQFSKKCEHWSSERHGLGKPPLLFLTIGGRDGRDKSYVPLETDGFWWWADVKAIELGAPGESLSIMMVTTIQGKSARGVSAREFLSKKGKAAMSFSGIMKWDLV